MSFGNTKTPTRAEITKPAKFQIHQSFEKYKHGEFMLEGDIKEEFIKRFPKTPNRKMMELFGIGFSTLQRLKRELGLKKDMKVIRKKLASHVKRICENNGWYDSLRGKAPSDACKEGYKRKVADGFHPLKSLKENNPRRYKTLMRKRSDMRKDLERNERMRVNVGLEQMTGLHRPQFPFSRQQLCFRYCMLQQGYILGDKREMFGERYNIYFDENTKRSRKREMNADKLGFNILKFEE